VLCKGAFLPVFPALDTSIPMRTVCDRWRRRVDHVALTGAIRDDLVNHGVPSDRIHDIPNGVPLPVDEAEVAGATHVLCVGNLSQGSAHKAFDVLIQAWSRTIRAVPEARLTVAGRGDARPWRELAERLGCGHSVEFPGYLEDREALYRDAAVFVLPSRGEGISNALLEAQSRGIPAVVSDVPGNCAVVRHMETGLIVPVGSVEDTAEAMESLLRDEALRVRLGRAARERIRENFSMDAIAGRYAGLYAELLAR
jgi:glycosyltransferase involved in cell wall biosynthesis